MPYQTLLKKQNDESRSCSPSATDLHQTSEIGEAIFLKRRALVVVREDAAKDYFHVPKIE
jgi:hypothetical protein